MPIRTGGGLETISLVITEEQARRLRALCDSQKTASRRISVSHIAREVIDAGLKEVSFVAATDSIATGKEQAA